MSPVSEAISHGGRPDAAIARWIRRMLAPVPPRARSLTITIWGDLLAPHGGEVWLSTLFRLLAPFGCNERLVRTSVFRLARDGWLAALPAGRRTRYRLTPAGAHRFALAYRRVYAPPSQHWDGRFEIVLLPEKLGQRARRTLRDELAWEGFAAIAPGLLARPSRGKGRIAPVASAHAAREHLAMFEARDYALPPGARIADRVESAYDLGTLAGEYRRFVARFAGVTDAFRREAPQDPEQGFVVRTLLVHEYRRVRLRDPQLPRALLPHDWPGATAYALCRDLYLLVQPFAEAHLARVLEADGDAMLPALPEFLTRFSER